MEKNISRGTKKKLLPLPFEVAKKKPFKGKKILKQEFKGIEKTILPTELWGKLNTLNEYLEDNNAELSLKILSELVQDWNRY